MKTKSKDESSNTKTFFYIFLLGPDLPEETNISGPKDDVLFISDSSTDEGALVIDTSVEETLEKTDGKKMDESVITN